MEGGSDFSAREESRSDVEKEGTENMSGKWAEEMVG